MISICFVLLFAVLANANINKLPCTARIYSNLAELIQPLGKLPLEFSDEDWSNLRPDSITLVGENLNITLQTITEKKNIFNGTQIYIRSPISSDKTTIKLIKATLIDEKNYLVKIQDESIAGQQPLYFTVPQNQIFYLQEPIKSKYYVNFKYITPSNSKVFVSYLRSNINWKTQYHLNLYDDRNDLIVTADIRNDDKSPIVIEQAELIGGDINLRTPSESHFRRESVASFKQNAVSSASEDSSDPTVEQGKELAGLYVFPITKPFTIDGKANYLLPMFRPEVSIDRYGFISKTFSTVTNTGKAQRSYRLKSNRYLSQGNCIIREKDRLVGETSLPNLAAKDHHDFSIGEDADLVYKENVKLISSTTYNDTEAMNKHSENTYASRPAVVTHTRFIYEIHLQVKNFKNRPINIKYEQKGFNYYNTVKLTKSNIGAFSQEGSSIKSTMMLKANTVEKYSYTVELVR